MNASQNLSGYLKATLLRGTEMLRGGEVRLRIFGFERHT